MRHPPRLPLLVAGAALALVAGAIAPVGTASGAAPAYDGRRALAEPADPPARAADGPPVLRVSGNKLVDESGATRRLLGVNRSGGEFACVQGTASGTARWTTPP